jgi:hypothetical protein
MPSSVAYVVEIFFLVVGFWLSPNVQAVSTMTTLKPTRKKKVTKAGKPPGKHPGIFKLL